jgi:hypothetical protein
MIGLPFHKRDLYWTILKLKHPYVNVAEPFANIIHGHSVKNKIMIQPQVPKDEKLFKYRIAKDTKVPFEEGKLVVIDDSFEHEMINDSDDPVIWCQCYKTILIFVIIASVK